MMSCSAVSSSASDVPIIRMPMMEEILRGTALRPYFQPIIMLARGAATYGYESLARYRENPLLRDPAVLFHYAERKHRVSDLELACAAATLEAGSVLARRAFLFLNIHPDTFSDARGLCDRLLRHCQEAGVNPDRIVLEITEQATLTGGPLMLESVGELRAAGVRFAFDDVGVAYSHLPWIDKIKPAFLKVSQQFGTAFETDPAKTKIVANIVSLARSFGCEVIVEGIEDTATATAAAEMGIAYGQGFLFARPHEAETFL
jgi:EAL domain-containing protein (putative c-di-GMP-specific phosphodiesterase class I)